MENVIKLEGCSNQSGLASLKTKFEGALAEPASLIVDFSGVDTLDVRSLQIIASFQNEVSGTSREVDVRGVSDKLMCYLNTTGTTGIIEF